MLGCSQDYLDWRPDRRRNRWSAPLVEAAISTTTDEDLAPAGMDLALDRGGMAPDVELTPDDVEMTPGAVEMTPPAMAKKMGVDGGMMETTSIPTTTPLGAADGVAVRDIQHLEM